MTCASNTLDSLTAIEVSLTISKCLTVCGVLVNIMPTIISIWVLITRRLGSFYASIVLGLARKRNMLRHNVARLVANRRSSSLIARTKPVNACILVHQPLIMIGFSLLGKALFLVFLLDLSEQLSFIFSLPLLLLYQIWPGSELCTDINDFR